MRISTDRNDRGFIENHADAIVLVDGVRVMNWVIADNHLQAVMTDEGKLIRGKVEVEFLLSDAHQPRGKKKHG